MKPVFIDVFLHPTIKWELVRKARDRDLGDSDYAAMPDYPVTDENRSLFISYRQALRDIPDQDTDPDAIVWPVKPAFLK